MTAKDKGLSEIKEMMEERSYHHPEENKSLASSSVRAVGVSTY